MKCGIRGRARRTAVAAQAEFRRMADPASGRLLTGARVVGGRPLPAGGELAVQGFGREARFADG